MVATKDRKDRRSGGEPLMTGHLLVYISVGVAVGILILIGIIFFVGINQVEPSSPTLEELGAVVGNEDAVTTYRELRQEKFDSIQGLVQLLVIALAVPMLTLLLGYFSERQPKAERERRDESMKRRASEDL